MELFKNGALPTYTFATKPNANAITPYQPVVITDVGVDAVGSVWYSNGTKWIPVSSEINLGVSGAPMIFPQSGNIGNNGAWTLGNFPAGSLTFSATSGAGVTVTGVGTSFASGDVGKGIIVDSGKLATITAFTSTTSVTVTITGTLSTTTYANNAWQLTYLYPAINSKAFAYFFTNAIFSGSAAGIYYVEMSTTYSGTIFNNVYDPSLGAPPVFPTSGTAFSTTGPGAYNPTTNVAVTILSLGKLVGNVMGDNGMFSSGVTFVFPANTNIKRVRRILGTTLIVLKTENTSNLITSISNMALLSNMGVTNKQVQIPGNSDTGSFSVPQLYTSIDTTIDNIFNYTSEIFVNTDYIIINRANCSVIPS